MRAWCLLVLVALAGGCAGVGAAVRAVAPAPAGAPADDLDAGLGLLEVLFGTAAALGIGGPVAGIGLAAIRRGRALRAVVRGVEAGADPVTKRAVAKAAGELGAGAYLDQEIARACGRRVGCKAVTMRVPARKTRVRP